MAIKYIVETTSVWHKTNGYSSHFARITSTKTGKSIVIDGVGGESNAAALLFRTPEDGTKPPAHDWSEVYKVQVWEDTEREWKRRNKFANGSPLDESGYGCKVYEHTITPAMIRRLNRK